MMKKLLTCFLTLVMVLFLVSCAPADKAPGSEVEQTPAAEQISESGHYTTKEDVALYLWVYGHLPENFITKAEARELGWEGGSLEPYAPGSCIGGSHFGNYEGLLPEDADYTECDIDTMGADSRGPKRLVFSDEGELYYTADHYESFSQIWFTDDYQMMEEAVK